MVDFNSYIQHGPPFIRFPPMGDINYIDDEEATCKCTSCIQNENLKGNQKTHYDGVKQDENWEDIQLLICPPRILGYHLKGKRWVELDVENIKTIGKLRDDSAFASLQLNKGQKTLIEKLVNNHASVTEKDPSMGDHMQGKGNGLVILLHGPPVHCLFLFESFVLTLLLIRHINLRV